jgi:hypothetical protein
VCDSKLGLVPGFTEPGTAVCHSVTRSSQVKPGHERLVNLLRLDLSTAKGSVRVRDGRERTADQRPSPETAP